MEPHPRQQIEHSDEPHQPLRSPAITPASGALFVLLWAIEWVELELYLATRAAGLPVETPAVRP